MTDNMLASILVSAPAMKQFMERMVIIILLVLTASNIDAQKPWSSIQKEELPTGLMIPSPLYEIARYAAEYPRDKVIKMMDLQGFRRTNFGEIMIEVWAPEEARTIDLKFLEGLGATVTSNWRNLATATLPPERLIEFAKVLPHDHRMLSVYHEHENDNGPGAMNSLSYQNAGHFGAGIRIGLMDNGYSDEVDTVLFIMNNDGFSNVVSTTNHRGGAFNDGDDKHGTGCLEVIYDHAPAADHYIHRASTAAQWGNAVDDLIAQNVDLLSISMGRTNTGWNDDTGGYCQAMNAAADAGILVLTSNGNEALKHWQGDFKDGVLFNSIHEWANGSEENLLGMIADSINVNIKMQWDSTDDDYFLMLWDATADTLLDFSAQFNEYEEINWTNFSGSSIVASIRVQRMNSIVPEFELFVKAQELEEAVAASSIESPTNSSRQLVLGIGAVGASKYGDMPGTAPIKDYSSQGPTNNGRQAPDLAALTDSPTLAYANPFNGTSAATPNAAGAIAALWSSHPLLSAEGVLMIVKRKAQLFKDWGDPGADNIYGHGGLYLKDHTSNTRYILHNSGNNNGTSTIPYSTMEQADMYAPHGSNLFFLGGIFQQPSLGVIINDPMIYRSVVQDAQIK